MPGCICGRSPTGMCIGWHNLTVDEYQAKTEEEKVVLRESDTGGEV